MAGNDASRVTLGTVPGTVPGVVRAVVLGATWGANLAAKSAGSRVAIGEPNSTGTWTLSRVETGRASDEGTWKVCCGASRGLTCGPVSAVVCVVIRIATCAASWKVRRSASARAGCPVPTLAPASGCCRRLREMGRFSGETAIRLIPGSSTVTCGESTALKAGFSAASRTHK